MILSAFTTLSQLRASPEVSIAGIFENLGEYGPLVIDYAVKIVGVLLALIVSFRIAAWLEARVRNVLERRSFDRALTLFFASLARWLLIVAAVIACLSVFGIDTTTFAAVLGAAGLAIGLAFQGTLSNFASGVLLLTFRPFKIGDFVDIAGTKGVVAEIGLFMTALDTVDNRRIVVSNSAVSTSQIDNYNFHSHRRVDTTVGVSYEADMDAVRKVLEEVALTLPLRDPQRGHQVLVAGFADSSVNWNVRVWCKNADYWVVWDTLHVAIKKALDANGIAIPFPQLDVHLPEPPHRAA